MKLRILSDLHLEVAPWTPPPASQDVVLLAGDIGLNGEGVSWAIRHFDCPVLYVPGNHEHYGSSLEEGLELLRMKAHGSCVRILSDEEVVLGGVRFLGATLWTDYRLGGREPLSILLAPQMVQDFRYIQVSGMQPLVPSHILEMHQASRRFLHRRSSTFPGKTVVITHHAPSYQSVEREARLTGSRVVPSYYGSSLEHTFKGIDLWVHGHVHAGADYTVGQTRVLCNPRGYARDLSSRMNRQFQPDLVVEI
jgi:predicted phosphodiesterase